MAHNNSPTGKAPCPECRGSGYQAMGCNLFPCSCCGGKGISEPAVPGNSSDGKAFGNEEGTKGT